MKILLINPASKEISEKKPKEYRNNIDNMEPLGICYLQAISKSRGHKTLLIDQLHQTNEKLLKNAEEFKPDIVMFTSLTANYNNTAKIANDLKKAYERAGKHLTILLGGYHVSGSILREDSETPIKNDLKKGIFDFVIRGEGEATVDELLEFIENKDNDKYQKEINDIKGIAYWDTNNNEIKTTGLRNRLSNEELAELEKRIDIRTLRDGLDMNKYQNMAFGFPPPSEYPPSKQKYASIYTQRGCSENCEFCQTPVVYNDDRGNKFCKASGKNSKSCNLCINECESKKFRVASRSVESVINEMEYLINEKGINSLFIRDETFGLDKDRTNKLLDEMIKRGIGDKAKWSCFLRADSIAGIKDGKIDINMDFVEKLKKAGCYLVPIGIESPSRLNELRKGVSKQQIAEAFKTLNTVGIKIIALIMIGFPGETKDTLEESLKFLKEIPYDRIRVSFVTPFESTAVYKEIKKNHLFISENYDLMDAEQPVIKTPKLQKELDRDGKEENAVEYLKQFRQRMFDELYTDPNYTERQIEHLEKAQTTWGEKWASLWVESHMEHFKFIHDNETQKFDGEKILEKVENKEVKEMIEKIKEEWKIKELSREYKREFRNKNYISLK